MSLLEVDGLRYAVRLDSMISFRKRTKQVLKGVSFRVEEGQSIALLGASGSGKSTLARCIVGLQNPNSGTITYKGVNIFPQIENRNSFGCEIQMLFQASGASLDPSMTVLESLAEAIDKRAGKISRVAAEAEGLLASVGLSKTCLPRLPSQLSGGQRQRVALARALSVAPRLLVLDEPTSALDALMSADLLRLLKSMQTNVGAAFLFITHHVQIAINFCDRIAVLHDGVIVDEGFSKDLYLRPRHEYTQLLLKESGYPRGFIGVER
jgi:peptide/nickel transport system ATP-binding protein